MYHIEVVSSVRRDCGVIQLLNKYLLCPVFVTCSRGGREKKYSDSF